MVTRYDDAAAVVVEIPGSKGPTLARSERVVQAIRVLHEAGYDMVLLPPGTVFKLRSRRRWWRGERSRT
jgi:hypothetical protein